MLDKIALLATPILIAILAWFIKRHIEQTDSAIKSLRDLVEKVKELFFNDVTGIKADMKIMSHTVSDLDGKIQTMSHVIAKNLEDTRRTYLDNQNNLIDKSAHLISQYEVIKGELFSIKPRLEDIVVRIEKHGKSLQAAAEVMKSQQAQLKILEGQIIEIGKVIWLKDEKPKR